MLAGSLIPLQVSSFRPNQERGTKNEERAPGAPFHASGFSSSQVIDRLLEDIERILRLLTSIVKSSSENS